MEDNIQQFKFYGKFIYYILYYFMVLPIGVAQSTVNNLLIINETDALITIAEKQLEIEGKLSDKHRSLMLRLIEDLRYDEELILGANREYWKEGLSKKFRAAPQSVLVKYHSRNIETIQLENTHVELYESDRRLYFWKDIIKHCNKIKLESTNKFQKKLKRINTKDSKKALLCYLLEEIESKRNDRYNTDILLKRRRKYDFERYSNKSDNTKMDSIIFHAYPYNGQVNFFIEEFVRGFGYLLLDYSYQYGYNSEFAIRWIDETGRSIVKEAKYHGDVNAIIFDLPKLFLKPGGIYKYQLLILPEHFNTNFPCNSKVLDHELIKALAEYIPKESINGDVVYEAHFRCSLYGTFNDKIDAILNQGHALNNEFELVLGFREPFSDLEIMGNNILSPEMELSTDISSKVIYPNGIHSIELKRILTTPQILEVDTLDKSENLAVLENKFAEIKGIDEKKYHDVDYLRKINMDQAEITGKTLKSISIADFKNNRRFNDYFSYQINFPLIDSLSKVYTNAQNQLKDRITLRAEYFKLLDIKIRILQNDPTRYSLEHFIGLENAKLSDKLKKLINEEMNLSNEMKCHLNLSYSLPGLEQKTSVHSIKFDLLEK